MDRTSTLAPLALALLASAAAGCEKQAPQTQTTPAPPSSSGAVEPRKPPAATASGAPSAPPAASSAPLTLKRKAGDEQLKEGLALMQEEGLHVFLSNQPMSCEELTHPTKFLHDNPPIDFNFTVNPGPGGRFFVGHRIGVPGGIFGPPGFAGTALFSSELTVLLDAAGGKPGDHVKGWAEIKPSGVHAVGAFDATVCEGDEPGPGELPADLPVGDVTGAVDGVPFTPKRAFARVHRDVKGGDPYLADLQFYAEEMSCADLPVKDELTPSLEVLDMGGASQGQDFSGTQQPTRAHFAPPGWKVGKMRTTGVGWIQIERLEFSAGKRVQGALRLGFKHGGVAGRFTAEVCASRK